MPVKIHAAHLKVDIPENSKASEVKDFVARELQMSPYTFKLLLGDKQRSLNGTNFGWKRQAAKVLVILRDFPKIIVHCLGW